MSDDATDDISTEATLKVLRATFRNTNGPAGALSALTVALVSLQQYVLSRNPELHPLIVAIAVKAQDLPAEVGRDIAAMVAYEVHKETCPKCGHPERFYGEA